MWARLYTALQLCVVTGCQVQVHTLCTLYTPSIQRSPTESPPAGFPPAAHSVSLRRVIFWFNSVWRHENGTERKPLLAPKIFSTAPIMNSRKAEKCCSQFSLKIPRECYCAISQIKNVEENVSYITYCIKEVYRSPGRTCTRITHKMILLSARESGFVNKIGIFLPRKKSLLCHLHKKYLPVPQEK